MTLTSIPFLLFTGLALAIYSLAPEKHRWKVLLAASIGYYWILCGRYSLFILLTTVSTFCGGLWLHRLDQTARQVMKEKKARWTAAERKRFRENALRKKKLALTTLLLLNFGILAFLKYYNFFAESLVSCLALFGNRPEILELGLLLPLGISFYTFQSMGYLIDVYRGNAEPERNLARFALFVSFFPQIIQGPISFYGDLAPQLYRGSKPEFKNIKSGSELILWGFFKKLVIADRAVVLIRTVTGDPAGYSGTMLLLTALMYALQLYADFSGGIDITRGIAELFGIILPENFLQPYFARDLSDYWRRWHITLGAWLKAYLFYPIAMSKTFQNLGKAVKKRFGRHLGKVLPTSLASLLTFLVIGIWHGANWKYVGFGLWNGLIIMGSTLLEETFSSWKEALKIREENPFFILFQMARTFVLVLVGYYFDIAENLSGALSMLVRSVTDFHFHELLNRKLLVSLGIGGNDYRILLAGGFVILLCWVIAERSGKPVRESVNALPYLLQCVALLAGIAGIVLFGIYGPGYDPADFVYMQF